MYVRAFGSPVADANGRLTARDRRVLRHLARRSPPRSNASASRSACASRAIMPRSPMWTTDAAGMITMSEGAGLRSLGVKSGELVGKKLLDVYGAHPTIPGYIRRGFAGESFWYTVEVGEAVYHSWLAPLRGPSGEVAGLAGLSHDISELHHLQRTMMQNDRVMALGTLAASVAHEINNPLTYVLATARTWSAELDVLEKLRRRARGPGAARREGVARSACATDSRPSARAPHASAPSPAICGPSADPEESSLGPVDLRGVVLSVLKLVRQGRRSARADGPRPARDAARQWQRRASGPGGAEPNGERDAGAPRRAPRSTRSSSAPAAGGRKRSSKSRTPGPECRSRIASASSSPSSRRRRSASARGLACSSAATSCAACRAT